MTVREKVRELKRKGLTLKEIASKCKISRPTLYKLLRNRKPVRSRTANRVAFQLNIPVERIKTLSQNVNLIECRAHEYYEIYGVRPAVKRVVKDGKKAQISERSRAHKKD